MDLQSSGGEPVNSDNAYTPANFRTRFPQMTDDHRRQPDTPASSSPSLLRATTASQTPQTPTITLEIGVSG